MPRFHCPVPLTLGAELELPAAAARHVQVLRLQPGGVITLFNGEGGEHSATILRMGRSDVAVRVDSHQPLEREASRRVHLALGMPANERMDWLVEKAAELGVASVQPLHTAHSVLRLSGERATKKQGHWQSVAIAACEQCGGNRVPAVRPVADLMGWLKQAPGDDPALLRCVL
jgi:16S rRNA (uracil1498-N3)-methyltransferase